MIVIVATERKLASYIHCCYRSLYAVKIIQPMALPLMDPMQQHENFKVSPTTPTMINFVLMYYV